jgi:hypothetical protein
MVALYMDEDVHGDITRGLLRLGIDVVTVQSDGKSGADDSEVMDRATELGRPVFTNDDDLLAEAHARQAAAIPFSGVIYAHALTPIGSCVRDLELIAVYSEPEEWENRATFVPLR